ncbi:hypothetical protein SAMN02745857_00893 [Andreprevotia lacus DSM 23236]|jgi:hypothetical protein|uniref:Uncharacterized protein n=1 Tax=Andreprevotia lacus DSM 23236 TaxID=1121001 RepID=A0A1W1X8Z3_9NEIS|nr:hypothetical protein [Andreprevotia lacus]SMC20287.1 hypothetical protein SAMN02745857_00893 [Andreprevotia lacus DSM 23236]
MSLLDDLTSQDPQRIRRASGAIRDLRDRPQLLALAAHIDAIRHSTADVELGGMLRPNRSHLDFALRKLALVAQSDACLCGCYPLDDLYSPNEEARDGHIEITAMEKVNGNWFEDYLCRCTHCGQRFRVEEQEYHYMWWRWLPQQA